MKLSDARNDATLIYGEKNEASTRTTASLPVELVNPGRQPGFPAARIRAQGELLVPRRKWEVEIVGTSNGKLCGLWKIYDDFSKTTIILLVFHLRVIFKFYISFFLRVHVCVCACVCVLLNTLANSFDVRIFFV